MKDNIKQIFSNMTIGKKLLTFFIILIAIPLIAFTIIFSEITSSTTNEQFEYASNLYVNQVLNNIDKELEEQDSTLLSLQWDEVIQNEIKKDYTLSTLKERQNSAKLVTDKMQTVLNSRLGIELFYLIRNDDEEFWIASSIEAEEMATGLWYKNEKISDLCSHKNGQISWLKVAEQDNILLGMRDVYDTDQLDKIGLIIIGIKDSQISDLYSNLKTTTGSYFVIFGDNGEVILTDSTDDRNNDDIYHAIQNKASWSNLVNGYNIAYTYSEYSGWYIAQVTPNAEIISIINRTRFILFGIIFIILAILLFVTRSFANTMVQPIRELMIEMDKVRKEDFQVNADESRHDEFGELATDFNLMVKKINNLIVEDYQKQLVLQEAEYKYLRAQINPHFLYNTLDSINWMAAEAGQKNISKIAVSLGRLLRRSISNRSDVVLLSDELEALNDYIIIQKMRYGDRLNVDIDIPDKYLVCAIPRSTLQPIVENSLMHGIDKKHEAGNIVINTIELENMLIISICDDGIGMSEERAAAVLHGNLEEESMHTGVGVKNVNKRLNIIFGEEYGLMIESEVGVGTTVLVKIPLNTEVNMGERRQ